MKVRIALIGFAFAASLPTAGFCDDPPKKAVWEFDVRAMDVSSRNKEYEHNLYGVDMQNRKAKQKVGSSMERKELKPILDAFGLKDATELTGKRFQADPKAFGFDPVFKAAVAGAPAAALAEKVYAKIIDNIGWHSTSDFSNLKQDDVAAACGWIYEDITGDKDRFTKFYEDVADFKATDGAQLGLELKKAERSEYKHPAAEGANVLYLKVAQRGFTAEPRFIFSPTATPVVFDRDE